MGIGGVQFSSNEAYNPVTNDWTERAPMPTARHHHASGIAEGKLFIFGGRETGIGSNTDRNEMYDPELDTWTVLSPMPTKRSGLSASSIGNQVFAMGGQNETGGFDLMKSMTRRQTVGLLKHHCRIHALGMTLWPMKTKYMYSGEKLTSTKSPQQRRLKYSSTKMIQKIEMIMGFPFEFPYPSLLNILKIEP